MSSADCIFCKMVEGQIPVTKVYEDQVVETIPGDVLFLLSDGIPEAMNTKREMFGFERTEETIASLSPNLSAREMRDVVFEKVGEFAGKAAQHDDMTLVVVRVTA